MPYLEKLAGIESMIRDLNSQKIEQKDIKIEQIQKKEELTKEEGNNNNLLIKQSQIKQSQEYIKQSPIVALKETNHDMVADYSQPHKAK